MKILNELFFAVSYRKLALMPLKITGGKIRIVQYKTAGSKIQEKGVYSNAGSNTYLCSISWAKVLNCNRNNLWEYADSRKVRNGAFWQVFWSQIGWWYPEPGHNGRKCPLIQKRTDCLGRMAVTYWRYFILGRFDINQITGSWQKESGNPFALSNWIQK